MQASSQTLQHNIATVAEEFGAYAYSVSHDLSAPVRAMVEFSKLLAAEQTDALSAEGKEYLQLIIENGEALQVMMQGLLQYSRLNTMAKSFCAVQLNQIVADCQLIMAEDIAKTGATLQVSPLPTLTVDIEQITQLFHSLLENALKFQPAGNTPHITIAAEAKAGQWEFAVTDNGIGIAPPLQQAVFKLFRRLHPEGVYSGAGIGLTLAEKIVHRHGGTIWVEQAVPQGTIVRFTLAET
jgi:light-regulated signal transduction histidine kinase (bacteriophytochrome)